MLPGAAAALWRKQELFLMWRHPSCISVEGVAGAPSVLSQTSPSIASQPPSQGGTDSDLYLNPLCVSLEVLSQNHTAVLPFPHSFPQGSPHTYAFYSLSLCRPD